MKVFKIDYVETVSHESNVKIVTFVNEKPDQNVKRIEKHSMTSPDTIQRTCID